MTASDSRYATPEAAQRAKDSRKAAGEARDAAIRRLKAENPERYRELYAEEARKRGITPAKDKRAGNENLKSEPEGEA